MPMTFSPPELLELDDAWREKIERFREAHADDPVGDVAQVILFEDDHLRIWEMKLAPGECSDLHVHELPYYLVIMSGDLVAGVSPKGSPVESFVGVVPKNGNTVPIPPGAKEWAWNVGERTYHEVLIELKA